MRRRMTLNEIFEEFEAEIEAEVRNQVVHLPAWPYDASTEPPDQEIRIAMVEARSATKH